MYNFQNTVLIEARPTRGTMALRYLTLILAALGLLACIWLQPLTFAIPAILLLILWWWVWFHSGIEFEYAYFEGGLDFDKIIDKRKRKSILSIHMDQVEVIAPVGDASLQRVHQETHVKYMDLSSRKNNRKFYELVWKDGGETICLRFEPDDHFLDSIAVKYRRKVIR